MICTIAHHLTREFCRQPLPLALSTTYGRLAGVAVHALADDEVRLLVFNHLQPARKVADLAFDRRHLLLVVDVHDPVDVEAGLARPKCDSRHRLAPVPDLVGEAVQVPSRRGRRDRPRALRLAEALVDLHLARPDDLGSARVRAGGGVKVAASATAMELASALSTHKEIHVERAALRAPAHLVRDGHLLSARSFCGLTRSCGCRSSK